MRDEDANGTVDKHLRAFGVFSIQVAIILYVYDIIILYIHQSALY